MVTRYYLDTSVAVHALRGTRAAEAWFDRVTAEEHSELVSSRLLQTEMTRVLRRDDQPVLWRDAILRHVELLPMTDGVLAGAEAIAAHVKTLDAIHLASALTFGTSTVVVSHDAGVVRAAESLGLATFDPIEHRMT